MVQFRQSKKVGPFRFTLSNRGLSTSVGAGPLRFSRGADGKVRRTVRVPGLGLYDTKVIDPPPVRVEKPLRTPQYTASSTEVSPPPGWYPDPGGSAGRAYWNGREWGSPPPSPPINKRGVIIAGSVVGAILVLLVLSNAGSESNGDSAPSAPTVTRTVTVSARPTTVTMTAPPTTVTVQAEQPPSTTTVTQAAPPPVVLETPAQAPAPYLPPASSNVYYENCDAARGAGAAPLRVGEPGYRPGLDRDGDGVACE